MSSAIEVTPLLYSLAEVSKALGGKSVFTLKKHAALRHFEVVRLGRNAFVTRATLERIAANGLPPLPKPKPHRARP